MPSFHDDDHDGAAAAPVDAAEDDDDTASARDLDDVDGGDDDAAGPDHAAADARADDEGEADRRRRRGKFWRREGRREEGGQRVGPHRQPLPQLVHLVDQHHGHERGAGDARRRRGLERCLVYYNDVSKIKASPPDTKCMTVLRLNHY